ncbi:MAG: hypothetical protein ACREVJ_13745, partial [Gammaproteobacteria bacterium]
LKDSRYEDLEAALREFLFRVAGWRRSAEAIMVAEHFRVTARSTLSQRLAGMVEDAKKRSEVQERAKVRRQQFDKDWGPQGEKRRELEKGIQRTATQAKRSLREALQLRGRIADAQRQKIDAVQSREEAERLNEAMPQEVAAAALNEWRKVSDASRGRCAELLAPFLEDADAVNIPEGSDQPDLKDVRGREMQAVENKVWARFKGASREYFTAGILANIVLSISTGGLALIAVAGGVIGAAIYGWISSGHRDTRAAQDELRKNLDTVLQQVQRQLLETDVETGRDGLVEEYFAEVERTMLEQVQTVVEQKEQEARAEHARLVEAGKLDEQQRKNRVEQTRRQRDEWDVIGKVIDGVSAQLNKLDTPAAVPAPVAG